MSTPLPMTPSDRGRYVTKLYMQISSDHDSLAEAADVAEQITASLPKGSCPFVTLSQELRPGGGAEILVSPNVPALLDYISKNAPVPDAPLAQALAEVDAPSVDDVRAACKARFDAGLPRDAIEELLRAFGASSISSVPPEKRADFIVAIRSLC